MKSVSFGPIDLLDGFWFNATTLVLTVVFGVIAAYFAWRQLGPHPRRLSIVYTEALPLLAREHDGVEVRWKGEDVPNPHIMTVTISNTGKHAINSSDFDQARPLHINFGVKGLSAKSYYKNCEGPWAMSSTADKCSLLIGPDLIPSRAALTLNILAIGPPAFSITHHLIDVRVECRVTSDPNYVAIATDAVLDTMVRTLPFGQLVRSVVKRLSARSRTLKPKE